MNFIYKTPNGKHAIIRNPHNAEWESVFDVPSYDVLKYDEDQIEEEGKTEWFIIWSSGKLEDCIHWLRDMKLISKNEAEYQISLLTKEE